MKKWYYKIVAMASDPAFWQSEFDRLGNEGWEFVQVVEAPVSEQKHAIFRKTDIPLQTLGMNTNQWM